MSGLQAAESLTIFRKPGVTKTKRAAYQQIEQILDLQPNSLEEFCEPSFGAIIKETNPQSCQQPRSVMLYHGRDKRISV